MNLVFVFGIMETVGIAFSIIVVALFGIAHMFDRRVFDEKVYMPWEKEEQREAKRKEREERRARKEFYK